MSVLRWLMTLFKKDEPKEMDDHSDLVILDFEPQKSNTTSNKVIEPKVNTSTTQIVTKKGKIRKPRAPKSANTSARKVSSNNNVSGNKK